MNSVVKY